jgi:glycosyltransferase involved in cell wall biosynthesis
MSAKNLSILIPARNEMFLKNTFEDALKNSESDTEIIVALDGAWGKRHVNFAIDVYTI